MGEYPIVEIAEKYEQRFTAAFLSSVRRARKRVTLALVTEAMERGLVDEPHKLYEIVEAVEYAKTEERARPEVGVLGEAMSEAAQYEAAKQGYARLKANLNITSPHMLEAAKKQAGNLIEGATKETKKAIRDIIFLAVRDGGHPDETAPIITQSIGLTHRDALALSRFASTAASSESVQAYGAKLLENRSLTIARTETLKASHTGQQAAWKEMARDGVIDTRRFTQRWIVTPDDRLCAVCAPMRGQQVPLNTPFISSVKGVLPSERIPYAGMTIENPPLHPNCRCTLNAEFAD